MFSLTFGRHKSIFVVKGKPTDTKGFNMFNASEARDQNYYSVYAAQVLNGIEVSILSKSAYGEKSIEWNAQIPVFVANSVEQELTRNGYDVRVSQSETFVEDVDGRNVGFCWARFEIEW